MNDLNTKPGVEQGVMNAIRQGRVKMLPKWRFVLSSMLAALGVVIIVCTLLYIASFAIFTMRQSGAFFGPEFGWRGTVEFFAALPVVLIILLILFVVVLEILVRRYRVGYRMPLLVSAAAILFIVLVGGYAIERTKVHVVLYRDARSPGGLPPPIAVIYGAGTGHVPGIYRGAIVSTTSQGFLLIDENGAGTTTVIVTPKTRLPLGAGFRPGEEVVVFGDDTPGGVQAFGVREVGE